MFLKSLLICAYNFLALILVIISVFVDYVSKFIAFKNLGQFFRLCWDVMLKMTGVKLEKTPDIDMHLFIEKELRGRISYIAKRFAKANNKYMNDYDPINRQHF